MPEEQSPPPESLPTPPVDPTPVAAPLDPAPIADTPVEVMPPPAQPVPTTRTITLHTLTAQDRSAMNAERLAKRELKLDQLIAFAHAHKKPLSNNDIQVALGVPDATATRYATILVTRGILTKTGSNKSTRYTIAK